MAWWAGTYEGTVNDRTYGQRTDGLMEFEGTRTTVLVPTRPDTIVLEVMARCKDLMPPPRSSPLQEKVASRVSKRADEALARAKEAG